MLITVNIEDAPKAVSSSATEEEVNALCVGIADLSRAWIEQACEKRIVDSARLAREKAELDEKRERLSALLHSEHGLSETDFNLLDNQGVAMRTYSSILGHRIERLEGES